jgi:nitroreductase
MRGDAMDVFESLYTTRAMRKMRPDPIPRDVQMKIFDAAIRAPSPGNSQGWRFLLVDDRAIIKALAPIYRETLNNVFNSAYAEGIKQAQATPNQADSAQMLRVVGSARYLSDHFEDVPLLVFAFDAVNAGQAAAGAMWSAQLAARAFGVGSSIVSALLQPWDRVKEIIRVPSNSGFVPATVVAFGYPLGNWAVAPRKPLHEVTFRNHWGEALETQVSAPLWPS